MSFYSFEMVLVGIILFIGIGIAGVRFWIKRKNESEQESFVNTKNIENNEDL
ncbi:MAG: hypothetical protein ACREAK_01515 [Nitrosarchaeum sp.]